MVLIYLKLLEYFILKASVTNNIKPYSKEQWKEGFYKERIFVFFDSETVTVLVRVNCKGLL